MFAATARKIASLLAIAYLLYAVLVAFIIVPATNGLAPIVFTQQTGRTLQFRNITLNPFTLRLAIDGVRNDNPDGSAFVAFDYLIANISLRSLWHGLTFDELRVDGLELHIAQTARDRFNFSDILDYRHAHSGAATSADDHTAANSSPAITVERLQFGAKHISVDAPYLATPLHTQINDIDLRVEQLTTIASTANNSTDALPPLAIRQLQLILARADVDLPREPQPFATHLEHLQVGVELFSTRDPEAQPFSFTVNDESGGTIKATGQLSLANARSSGELQIQQFSLLPAWRYLAPQLHFNLESGNASLQSRFDVSWRDAVKYSLDGSAKLANIQMQARDDANSRIELGALTVSKLKLDSATRQIKITAANLDAVKLRGWNRGAQISVLDLLKTEFPPSEPDNTPPWQLQLDQLALDNSRIDWHTDAISEPDLAITPLKISAKNLHWPDAAPADIALATTINGSTSLTLQGNLTPTTQSGALAGELKGLPLQWGNLYIEREVTATINRGTLTTQFQMELDQGQPTHIAAAGDIDDFQLLRMSNQSQLAAWQQLHWQQLNVDVTQQKIAVARVDLQKPEARFRINPDGSNNFQELVIPAGKTAAPTINKPGNSATATTAKPWQVAVDLIHLNNGELDFRDNSLPRPFHARIGEFTGDIKGLGTAENAVARVDLQGSVDGYAPVTLTGTAAPLRSKPALDIALDFTNLDLATFTTYSGTYAGYAINRGLLTLQLAYKLQDGLLQGRNRIVINRLELGERVRSPKAIDLPLRLAIALLTDENGVMDLGVDVSGNLDDPQFSVSGIIWKALRNVIVKAVTSPFRLLASLVGGGEEDFGLVDFEPGTDHIDTASRERLTKLTQALAKRQSLQVRIIGHADPVADANAMKQGKLEYFLVKKGATDDDLQTRNRGWAKAVSKLYAETFPDRKVGDQTPDQLELALRDNMTLGADAMDFIAARRSLAVKRVLVVDLGLATDRVLIDSARDTKDNIQKAQAELKLDN